jgi:hypothetical protein
MARNLQSQSFVKKKRAKMWLKGVGLLLVLILAGVLISWLFRLSFLTVSDVQVFGADPEITDAIHDVAVSKLTGDYLGIFSRKNTLIYPKNSIVSSIKSNFPRVLDVSISHDGLTHIRVTVNEKVPSAIVCATLPNFDGNLFVFDPTDPCYLADNTGFMYEKSPGFSGHPYHIYYAPDIALTASTTDLVGAYATSTTEFQTLQSFYDGIEHAGMSGNAMLLKQNGEYELYSSSTIIYFNDAEGISDELANLSAFWSHSMNDRTQKVQPVFDYIDLRYSPNVFYKIEK